MYCHILHRIYTDRQTVQPKIIYFYIIYYSYAYYYYVHSNYSIIIKYLHKRGKNEYTFRLKTINSESQALTCR